MAKKKKELVITPDEPLTPIQKGILAAMASFIPFFFLILLPMLTRNHILGTMNLSPEVILAVPSKINLVRTGQLPATYKVVMKNMEMKIPRDYFPVAVRPDVAIFRRGQRKMFRTISFGCYSDVPRVDLKNTGVIGWLVSSDLKNFFREVLPATWHPARMICKAQFYILQGINSQIFEAQVDEKHKAYIFPLSGNFGYIGRIFSDDSSEYVELALTDEVEAPTLRDWVDVATLIKPIYPKEGQLPTPYRGLSLSEALDRASVPNDSQWVIVENSLNRFYSTGSASWMLPVAEVLESRGYYREMIEFYRSFAEKCRNDPALSSRWGDSLDACVRKVMKMELDQHLTLNRLVGTCQNLGEFTLSRVRLKIIFPVRGGEKSFGTELFSLNPLHGAQTRELEIDPPPGLSVHIASEVRWRIEDIDIND